MTDNTQVEIDKILRRLVNRVERYAFEKWDSQPKDYPPGFRDVLFTQNMEDEATEAILDWHNKQVDEALYLFHWFVMEADIIRSEDDQTFNYARLHRAIDYYIAERNKLKESSNDKDSL